MALPFDPQAPNYALANQPGSQVAYAPSEQEGEASGSNLLAIAWRSRWLILLCTLLGCAAAWTYLQKVVPRYTSVARIYVEQSIPRLLASDPSVGGFSNNYLYTQAELIRSASVLAAAAEAPENASLGTFRSVDNPVALLRKKLRVFVGDRDDIISISIELENANDAAQIINSIVDAYITKYAERKRTSVIDVLTILRNEKQRRDEELEQRRLKLEKFRRSHLALAVQSGEDNVVTQLFSVLSSELNTTHIDLLEAKTRFKQASRMLENPDQLPFLVELALSGHNALRGAELESQVRQVEQNLIAQRSKWGEGYPAVKLLQESLKELKARHEKQQESVVTAYIDTLRQNYELLVQRRSELQQAYDKQFQLATEVSVQANELESLKEAYNRTAHLCDILDDRIKEVNLSEEVGAMNVHIMDVAAPGSLSYPLPAKMLAMGTLLGGLLGFGFAWLRDLLDHRLKSMDEIASALQLPVIGVVPLMAGSRSRTEGGRVVALQPRSMPAEAISTLRTSLHFGVAGPASKVFVVTSPAPGDGKSTVASNLAIAMAEADQRVLLIDADMRKPSQHEIFGIETDYGFSALLSGVLSIEEAVVPSGTKSLDILPCGKRPPNPVELLNNGVFPETLKQLLSQYDRIIIDSPPVMPVADVRLIAAMADCTILVLRAERSTRRMSVAARDELLNVGAQRLGIIVNAAPARRGGSHSGYGYGYGAYGQTTFGYGEEDSEKLGQRQHKVTSETASGEMVSTP